MAAHTTSDVRALFRSALAVVFKLKSEAEIRAALDPPVLGSIGEDARAGGRTERG